MKLKKGLSWVLTTAMVFSFSVANVSAAVFTDTQDHWAKSYIDKWTDLKVLDGITDTTYQPDGFIKRSEVASIVTKVMGYSDVTDNTFSDLKAGDWYTTPILEMNAQGLYDGMFTNKKVIRPTQNVTREEVFVEIARALGVVPSTTTKSAIGDIAQASPWAVGYLNAMFEKGYIDGRVANTVSPKDMIKRGEILTVLDRVASTLYNKKGTYTASAKGNVVINTSGVTLKGMTIGGDLIVAPGVGEGDVYLQDVTIKGRTIVGGGGSHSIHLTGKTVIGEIVIAKKGDNTVSIKVDTTAQVGTMTLQEGAVQTVGNFGAINVIGDNTKLSIDAKSVITSIVVFAQKVALSISGSVKAVEFDKNAAKGTVTVADTGTINTIVVSAGTSVANDGNISKLDTNGSGPIVVEGNKPAVVVDTAAPVVTPTTTAPTTTTPTTTPPTTTAPVTGGGGAATGSGDTGTTVTPPVASSYTASGSYLASTDSTYVVIKISPATAAVASVSVNGASAVRQASPNNSEWRVTLTGNITTFTVVLK